MGKYRYLLMYSVLLVVSVYLMVFIGTPYVSVFWDWSVWVMLVAFIFLDIAYNLLLGSGDKGGWIRDYVIFDCIVGPTVEELISRFFIMKVLFIDYFSLSLWVTVGLSNLFFTVPHMPWLISESGGNWKALMLDAVSIYFSGLLISVLYWFSGFNLLPAVVLHGAMNLTSDIVYYYNLPKKTRKIL